jgi:hypothetical protein
VEKNLRAGASIFGEHRSHSFYRVGITVLAIASCDRGRCVESRSISMLRLVSFVPDLALSAALAALPTFLQKLVDPSDLAIHTPCIEPRLKFARLASIYEVNKAFKPF